MAGRRSHKVSSSKVSSSKEESQRYDDYLKERDLLVGLEQSAYDGYEKAILTLSGAFLAFSVSFLGLLKSKTVAGQVPVLILATKILFYSWVSFATSVFAMIFNFMVSATGMRAAIVDTENALDNKITSKAAKWTALAMVLNYFAGIAFIVGVILLIRFCTVNLWAL